MPAADPPETETQRLAELREFNILDTVSEATYDAITFLAAQICDVPIALISIIDEERQWFKSRVGLEVTETHRDFAFCAHAIHNPDQLMVVPDALTDVRFSENPLVTGDPNIRFYAGSPLLTASGQALGTLCVIDREPRELTEAQELALGALSTQVMALLELRRTVTKLEEKQGELEQATQQREALMATVSHEIRTPLTAVLGFMEVLKEDDVPEDERRRLVETVARQAGEVEAILEDLLVAARAEADSLRVASVSVHLAAQVAQVLEGFRDDQVAGIAVDAQDCRATGDPARIRQIVRNLLTNAERYGGPNVGIDVAADGDVCHLLVSDDGLGVPTEDRELIFERFKQSEKAPLVSASVGLGLPISRMLAEKMDGSLEYRYENDHSVFDLTLPRASLAG